MTTGNPIADPILVKVGVAVIDRTVPAAYKFLKTWWVGKNVLVVGQARAGKSTFIDYLRHGIFQDEADTDKTHVATRIPQFEITIGPNKSLNLTVKTATEIPGQYGPVAHADAAFKENPEAIIVFADLTTPLDGKPDRACGQWLAEFCERLETKWRASKKKNKLKCIIIAGNKLDKVETETWEVGKKRFQAILKEELKNGRGAIENKIPVMPCILVTNPKGSKLVDAVITELAKALGQ